MRRTGNNTCEEARARRCINTQQGLRKLKDVGRLGAVRSVGKCQSIHVRPETLLSGTVLCGSVIHKANVVQ